MPPFPAPASLTRAHLAPVSAARMSVVRISVIHASMAHIWRPARFAPRPLCGQAAAARRGASPRADETLNFRNFRSNYTVKSAC